MGFSRRTLMYLVLALFSIFTIFPFVWMLSTSFKSQQAIFALPPQLMPDLLFKPGMFDAYASVLTDHNFIRFTFNSFFVATLAATGQLITSSLAGFAFARMQFRGRNVLFALLLSTSFIPIEVSIIPEFLLGAKIFDPLLDPIGGWLDTYAPLIIPSFMVGSFGTFLMREFFSTIPKELEEAAVIDGASTFRIYRSLFVPLSKPAMTTLFLIAFINNWNELLRPVLYISTRDMRTLTMGLTSFQGEYEAQWNLLLAGSVIAILPLVIVYIFAQRYIVQGIATTGLKG
ncbi:MAG: carbohydrate ABC transporter permease [Anaerolineae bacterium]|nr:carbohydrate ABC transporter permease [Anaerolineae bacterium]